MEIVTTVLFHDFLRQVSFGVENIIQSDNIDHFSDSVSPYLIPANKLAVIPGAHCGEHLARDLRD